MTGETSRQLQQRRHATGVVVGTRHPRISGPRSTRRLLADAFEGMEGTSQLPAQVPEGHISTGFADFDAMTQGLRRGSLVVLAGSSARSSRESWALASNAPMVATG